MKVDLFFKSEKRSMFYDIINPLDQFEGGQFLNEKKNFGGYDDSGYGAGSAYRLWSIF